MDRSAWLIVICRYIPVLAGLNLVWEIAQLPLYSIWEKGSAAELSFAVFHCTAGDVLIGLASMTLALTFLQEGAPSTWRKRHIVVLVVSLGLGYTLISEWFNTALDRWTYSSLMPVIQLSGVGIGVSPMLQWLLLPPLALSLSWRRKE